MSSSSFNPLYWETASPAEGTAPSDNEELLPHFLRDFRASSVITAIVFVASYIFKSPLLTSCLFAASCHLATRLIKKLFNDFNFMKSLEELSLTLLRKAPYIYVVASIVALLFVWFIPLVSWITAACIGILSGLTIEVHSDREHNRQLEAAGRV